MQATTAELEVLKSPLRLPESVVGAWSVRWRWSGGSHIPTPGCLDCRWVEDVEGPGPSPSPVLAVC